METFFIRWQLENRRYAAVRATGIYNTLARSLAQPLVKDKPIVYRSPVIRGWRRVIHFFFPLRGFAIVLDETDEVPNVLAIAWERLDLYGDNGIIHERVISIMMWVLFIIPVVRWFWHLR